MDWALLKKFLAYTSKRTGKSKIALLLSSIKDVYKYNISILEYFQFGFYDKTAAEKEEWAGTGTMYEFQKISNPINNRWILMDKNKFYSNYREFFKHHVYSLEELENEENLISEIYSENDKIVLKETTGKAGSGVEVVNTSELKEEDLLSYMKDKNFGILETYIKQHQAIHELSPSAVNTIRIFTQVRKDGTFEILGCRMRISVDSPVDNMAAGNLVAPVDEKSGVINGPAIYSDITKPSETTHPVTGVPIVGFQIPYWQDILAMIKEAALKHQQNKSVGWDVVVTQNGPGLIEGNHDWCKLVWQLPVNKGLKHRLDV